MAPPEPKEERVSCNAKTVPRRKGGKCGRRTRVCAELARALVVCVQSLYTARYTFTLSKGKVVLQVWGTLESVEPRVL